MIGKTILHYKILEKLGEGGMGVVYKAEDTKLKRTVALKFLPSSIMASEAEKTRFVHEAQTAAALDHPNICTIHEINEADGQLFIAMAYVEGQSLKEKIAAGPLKLDEALNIATQVADGLQAAHEKTITHRDIKPANIMIMTKGQAKIMDFGLAKLAGRTAITKEGMTLGTVAYMSPEQARGEEVDHRTDIWAFGVVLYEMITGQHPFKGEYDQAVMYSICHETPEPITGMRTGVPMELEQVVNKCLEKDAAKRYQHIDDVPVDLRRISEISSTKKTVSRPAAARKIKPAFLWPAVILSTVVLIIAGYFVFSAPEAESTERIPIAVADFVNQTGETELDGLSEMLVTSLEQSRKLAVLPRASMYGMVSRLGRDSITTFDEQLVREICARANVNTMATAFIRKLGQVYAIDLKILDLEQNKYLLTHNDRAEGQENIFPMLDRLSEKIRRELKEKQTEIAAANKPVATVTSTNLEAYNHYFQGMQFYYQGKWRDAQEQYEQAIAVDSTFGLAYMRLAMLYDWPGVQMELEDARKINQKALNLGDKIPEKERYLVKASDIMLNDSAPIRNGMRAAISILKEMEKRYPDDRDMLFQIGDYAFHTSQNLMASEYFDRFLKIEPDGFKNRGVLGHRFALYLRHNQFDEAEAFMNAQSIDLHPPPSEGLFGEGRPIELYLYRGQYRRALQIADERLKWSLQNNHPNEAIGVYAAKILFLMHGWHNKNAVRHLDEQADRLRKYPASGSSYHQYNHILIDDYDGVEKLAAESERDVRPDLRVFMKIQQGECEKAIAMADSVLNPIEERRFVRARPLYLYYALSFCYLEHGQLRKAIAALEEIQDSEFTYGWPSTWARALFYAKSFYGLGRVYEQQGDTLRALENYEKFLDLWKNADADLPELIDAKARYAKLKGMPEK